MDYFGAITFAILYSYIVCVGFYAFAYFFHGFKGWNWRYLIPLYNLKKLTKDINQMKTIRYFITNKNELIVFDGDKKWYQDTIGNFISPCLEDDFQESVPKEIKFLEKIPLALKNDEQFPQWKHLWSARTNADYRNWKEGLCNNGGAYSFSTTRHFFYLKHNGVFKFGFIDESNTSAEFSYTWDGLFQDNGTYIEFINGPSEFIPYFAFQSYENGEKVDTIVDKIDNYLFYTNFDRIFKTEFLYQDVDESQNYSELAINPENQTLILDKLKAEGFSPKINNRR